MRKAPSRAGTPEGVSARWGKVHAWWQWHPGVDIEMLGLLNVLSSYADEEGYCDPSQSTLARRAKKSLRYINGLIARMHALEPKVLEKAAREGHDGGNTSCLYRVVREAPPELSAWMAAEAEARAAGRAACASPGHDGTQPLRAAVRTMNQPEAEQNQNPRPEPRDPPGPSCGAGDAAAGPGPGWLDADGKLDRAWGPSEEVVGEAMRLYPAADLSEHTALFVSRSRAKGYCHADPDEAWLAWLIEDQRKSRERAAERLARGSIAAGREGQGMARLAAWGAAAASPAVHAHHR